MTDIKHYSKEQICSGISDKSSWINLINSVTSSTITGKKEGEPCPVCGGNDRFIFDNKRQRGNNLCRGCADSGQGGKSRTGLRLIADIENCSFDEACTLAGDFLRLTPENQNNYVGNNTKTRQSPPLKSEPKISKKEQRFAKKVIENILDGAKSIQGTPAETYLRARGLKVDYPIHNLRWAHIERYEKDKNPNTWKQDALIARLTDHEGHLESLQRTYLNSDNTKDTRKQTPKLTGNSNLESKASVKLFDPSEIMGIAEGVETALAAHELTGMPVWAALNSGRLKTWQPPKIVKMVFIFADLDQSKTGYEAASFLYHQLKKQAIEVFLLLPGTTISKGQKSVDFLDFLKNVRGLTYTVAQLKTMAVPVAIENEKKEHENDYQAWKMPANISIFPSEQVKVSQTTGKVTPKATLDNLSRLMEYYKVDLKYNEIKKKPEFTFPSAANFINEGEDLKANAAYGQIIDLMAINNLATTNIDPYMDTLQQKHTYNPVKDWITQTPWDGYDHLQDLINTVTVNLNNTDKQKERIELKQALISKWLLGSCALALGMIEELPFVLVFQSAKQGLGKTWWFRKLCPAPWRVDGVTLEVGNVDSERTALSHWLCELGEIDGTIKKSSMDSIKSFLSKTLDILRTPYSKYANEFKRRTAFFGTCNPTDFLRDDENRRFWVLAISKVDSYHKVNMQQVWAQCWDLLKSGNSHLLNKHEEELLNASNLEFLPEHIIESTVRATYDFNSDQIQFRKLSPQEILAECRFSTSDRQRYIRISGRYFEKLFGERNRSNGKTTYWVPPLMPSMNIGPFGDG